MKNRVKNLPQSVIQEHNYEQEPFLQRLAQHREDNLKNKTAVEYFEDMDISPVVLGDPRNCTFFHNIFILFILLCFSSEATLKRPFRFSIFATFVPSEITSNNKSDFLLLMRELFEVIGQPRNYDLSAQDGQHQEDGEEEDSSLSLWEERQSEKKRRRAENAVKWVGSTGSESVWNSQTDGEAASAQHLKRFIWLEASPF